MTDMGNFKPTNREPVSDQSKNFEKNFKKTMNVNNVKLNEIDELLTEKEQSLKKKIFSLAKMESLVFSDPKLTAIYDGMAENGEEKYGYHYNETIMNMIFNDYVLNSPKYLQKYKMAIPKKKKRRDKSGINQLRKASGLEPKKTNISETDENVTKVQFLVNEKDPKNPDVFAYFPEENHDIAGKYKTAYSHTGQHSACHPEYARESRPATPEEYADLKAELENHVGYKLEIMEESFSKTGKPEAQEPQIHGGKLIDTGSGEGVSETSTTGSVGGSGMGSGGYATPRAWSSKGDLMGGGKPKRKPIWKGGTIIQESNYLVDPSGFEKYFNEINEQINYGSKKENPEIGTQEFNKGDKVFDIEHNSYGTVLDNYGNPKDGDRGDIRLDSDGNVSIYQYDEQSNPISYNLIKTENSVNETEQPIKISTPEELKTYVVEKKARGEKGLTREDIPLLAGQALYNIAINTANRLLPISWNDLPDINSMWDYIDKNGGMTHQELINAVKEAVNDRLSEEGMSLDDLMENKVNEKATSKAQQRLFGMARAVQKGELNPSKVGGAVKKIAKDVSPKDVKDFAKTKHEDLPEKVDEYLMPHALLSKTIVDTKPKSGETPFIINGSKYEYEWGIFDDGTKDIVVYSYSDDVYYDYMKWRQAMGIDENNIKEDTQTMIQNNGTSMSNKPIPLGDLGNGVEMGVRGMNEEISKERRYDMIKKIQDVSFYGNSLLPSMDYLNTLSDEELTKQHNMALKNDPELKNKISNMLGLNRYQNEVDESLNLLEEINKELNAFSIHHDKLKKMTEDRKPSTLVLKDRLGDENKTNFKKDLQHSGTKEIINVEKELQWKDQQTDVGDKPQKLGQDIEKTAIKATKGTAFENVGDSANDKGDEVPKRNLTDEEQNEVDMYRLGQQDLVYDNEPSERFEERMKADMGEKMYDQRQKKLEFRGKAPMYNKDPQPIEDTTSKKVQFNKEQTGWNERDGLEESMITGRYQDILNKRKLIDFTLNEVTLVESIGDDLFKLDFTGLGNSYVGRTTNYKVSVNETVVDALDTHKFYTDGKKVFAIKNPIQNLSEGVIKEEKQQIDERVEKMKHLLGYKPSEFVNTKNVKRNRGF